MGCRLWQVDLASIAKCVDEWLNKVLQQLAHLTSARHLISPIWLEEI